MKKYKILTGWLTLVVLTGISCSDWLDVRPKSQIIAGDQFKTESGFRDVLTGVYISMASPGLYGREMTFGLTEALSQNYDLEGSNRYRYGAEYDYNHTAIRPLIDTIWSQMYNGIANLNLLLEHMDGVNPGIFTGRNYEITKGEALGLRSFLLFDLLRLFSSAYISNPNAPAIPYVDRYSIKVTSQQTVREVVERLITDLTTAAALLKSDPLAACSLDSVYYNRDRQRRFNYFAAKATLARVYLYKNDMPNALACAGEIIENDQRFSWVHQSSMETANANDRNLIFNNEHVFGLHDNHLEDDIKGYFNSVSGSNGLVVSEPKIRMFYEMDNGLAADWRQTYLFSYDGGVRYPSKLWQYNNPKNDYGKKMPLIRKTEMYYIAAECLKESNPDSAVVLLNTVRNHRNIVSSLDLPETLTSAEIQQEIFKEYRKELICEGQLFFYYKRLNLSRIEGAALPGDDRVYVLPMPENEIEFGDREQ